MEGICLTNPNPDYFLNMTGMACDSDANCTDDMFPVCVTPMGAVGGMCVPNDPSMICDLTGMSTCNTSDDCPSSMPICVNETDAVMGAKTCAPGCDTDSDCDDGWECEELP